MARRGLKKLEGETLGQAAPVSRIAGFDQKRIDAWNEIPEAMQFAIREALLKPTRLGAVINSRGRDDRNVKTSLGYVVHSSFVTPLARELIEALEFNGVEAPTKPKRRAS